MNLVLKLAPGYTATLQPSARGGAAVGSPLSPTLSGSTYTWDLSSLPAGDYDMQLSGNWEQNGSPFPCRITATAVYIADYWWEIETAVTAGIPNAPAQITGLCNVLVAVTFNGQPVVNGVVHCFLDSKNNTVDAYLVSRAIMSGVTNSLGYCTLTLIQFGQFTRGGIYRLRAWDAGGKSLQDRRVTVPNTSSATADDLVDVL